jgi:hypothetical protein
MTTLTFEKPVEILVGFGFPTTIRSVFMAYRIVDEWPVIHRGEMHAAALSACRAALNGDGNAEDARKAFIAFARRAGILIEDMAPVRAARTMGDLPSKL